MSLAKTLLLLCLIVLSAPARCADAFTYEPVQGSWYPIGAPGLYLGVDIGPTGFAFVTLHDFDEQGNERTRFLQGALEVSDANTRGVSGVFAKLRSEVYAQRRGSCIGCEFRQPEVVDLGGVAEIRFKRGQNGELDLDGRRIAIRRYPMYNGASGLPENQLLGKYLMLARTVGGDYAVEVDIVPFGPEENLGRVVARPADVTAPVPDRAQWRQLTCRGCATENFRLDFFGADLLIAYEGGDIVLNSRIDGGGGRIPITHTARPTYRLHDNEGVISSSPNPSDYARSYPGAYEPYFTFIREFTLVRLPDDWRF